MWKTRSMLILASRSQTRRSLLESAGFAVVCEAADLDERQLEDRFRGEGTPAAEIARRLAIAKTQFVASRHPDAVVVGADQVLVVGGELLHKPTDLAAARTQLDRLRGRAHALHAGVALGIAGRLVWDHVEAAELTMRAFSDAERDAILGAEGKSVLGAVGSYRLEGPSVRLFESVRGDYFTILGLPLLPLLHALRRFAADEMERIEP
jgi:septum formation protein